MLITLNHQINLAVAVNTKNALLPENACMIIFFTLRLAGTEKILNPERYSTKSERLTYLYNKKTPYRLQPIRGFGRAITHIVTMIL